MRKITRKIRVGDVEIGGGSPISVQSMTNTDTKDIEATVAQIKELEEAGCHIVRAAINDLEDARAIEAIKERINIAFIADIQYDYRLALEAAKYGADCLRINPGNIGSDEKVRAVVDICKEKKIPIRIGVNAGSISQEMLRKYKGVNADSMVYSAMEHVKILESLDFYDMKISLKASSVNLSIEAYEKMSELVDYPLHLGITEAGPIGSGTIKSTAGIACILSRGIGDTLRISLTGDPVEEVRVGRAILKSFELLEDGVDIISCPTCGRTKIDLIPLVNQAEKRLAHIKKPLKVAIMGCPVNGPGEAREADIGIAGGVGEGLLFKKGQIIRKIKEEDLLDELVREVEKL